MATAILIILFLTYIGLGVPDSLLGAAWPSMYTDFGVSPNLASYLSLCISLGTVLSSLCATRLISRLGTAWVTVLSTAMTAFALLGFRFSPGLPLMFLFSIPLGLGAGGVDTSLNHYVALNYKASHMSFLHCFYGIGVCCSPVVLSLSMSGEGGWRNGYTYTTVFQFALTAMLILSLPLWKRAEAKRRHPEAPASSRGGKSLLRLNGLKSSCLAFAASCSLEFTCGVFGATFLVEARGYGNKAAAGLITLYYVGITLGRFLAGVLALHMSHKKTLTLFLSTLGIGVFLLFLPFHPMLAVVALFLIGLGNGPVFPLLLHLTPLRFGTEAAQSVMGIQMGSAYLGIALAPFFFGFVVHYQNAVLFPVFLAFFFLCLLLALRSYKKRCSVKSR